MKSNLSNIISHLKFLGYPREQLQRIVYLLDWKHTLVTGERMFKEDWIYVPVSGLIIPDLNTDKIIAKKIELTEEEQKYLDFVLEKIDRLKYTNFIHLCFSTYPYHVSKKNEKVDLVSLAKEYISNNPKEEEILKNL